LEDRANMTRSVNNGDNISVKRQQRRGFLVGLIVAAVPILCQVLMLLALWAAPEAFPAADRTFTQGRFWPILRRGRRNRDRRLREADADRAADRRRRAGVLSAIAPLPVCRVDDVFRDSAGLPHRMELAGRNDSDRRVYFAAGLHVRNGNRWKSLNATRGNSIVLPARVRGRSRRCSKVGRS
jgi:hypothetical protein